MLGKPPTIQIINGCFMGYQAPLTNKTKFDEINHVVERVPLYDLVFFTLTA